MHDIAGKTGWWCEYARKTFEDTRLPDAGLESPLLVLGVGLRGNDADKILSIFEGIDRREVRDVEIWVVARRFVSTEGFE